MRPCANTLEAEMSPAELDLLQGTVAGMAYPNGILEIGTAAGGSLVAILDALAPTGQRPRVVTIDPMRYFPDQLATVERNLEAHGFGREWVEIRVGRAEVILRDPRLARERYDLILVDGSHKYRHVVMDLGWSDRLAPAGRLVLHDYAPEYPGVVAAVHDFRRRNPYYRVVGQAESLLVLGRDEGRRSEWRRTETTWWDVAAALLR